MPMITFYIHKVVYATSNHDVNANSNSNSNSNVNVNDNGNLAVAILLTERSPIPKRIGSNNSNNKNNNYVTDNNQPLQFKNVNPSLF